MFSFQTPCHELLLLLFAGACSALPIEEPYSLLGHIRSKAAKLQYRIADENGYQLPRAHSPMPPTISELYTARDVISFDENEAGNYSSPSRNYVLLGFLVLFFLIVAVFGVPSHYRTSSQSSFIDNDNLVLRDSPSDFF